MKIQITYQNDQHIPPDMSGKRLFLLHDFQCNDDNFQAYLPRVYGKPFGLPETEKMGDSQFEKMDESRQWFWFDLLRKYANGTLTESTLKQRWSDLTAGDKAFTNKHGGIRNPGTDKEYIDYINGTGNVDEPMSQENLTTCGNMVIKYGATRSIGGVPFQGVLCLDGGNLPSCDGIYTHPARRYFIHCATVCRPEPGTQANFPRAAIAPNGTFIVNPFPHLGGLDVPVPFVSSRGEQVEFMGLKCRVNWIAMRRLVTVGYDEDPGVYVK